MKSILLVLMSLLLFSCGPCRSSLDEIVNECKGHAIIMAKGTDKNDYYGHYYRLLIKDTKTNKIYEYYGINYEVNIGDTLK